MPKKSRIYSPVLLINGIIITLLFFFSALAAGIPFSLLANLSGKYLNGFFIPTLAVSAVVFYLAFVLLLAVYYRLLLEMIPEKETTLNLQEEGNARNRQILRFILSGITNDVALPLFYYIPASQKLFGAKTGRDCLIRARMLNPELIETGDNVLIADGSFLTSHLRDGDRLVYKKIRIGHNCTIGLRSIIFPGTTIGDHSIIAAYSLLPKNTIVPSREIWAGIPAKKIGECSEGSER